MTERKRRPRRVSDVIGDVLTRAGVADRIAQASVIPNWITLVGPQIGRVTAPMSITTQGTLFVAVTTNAWMNELSMLEPELLRKINERTGRLAIKRIRWQLQRQ